MTLPEAKAMLDAGAKFGAVYPMLAEPERDGEALKAHFVFGVSEPPARAVPSAAERGRQFTGEICDNCGGSRVLRTGNCKTCQDCGSNSGCS